MNYVKNAVRHATTAHCCYMPGGISQNTSFGSIATYITSLRDLCVAFCYVVQCTIPDNTCRLSTVSLRIEIVIQIFLRNNIKREEFDRGDFFFENQMVG